MVRRLSDALGEVGEDGRPRLAAWILDLDDGCETAHRALGHVQHQGRWMSGRERELDQRRAEIRAAVDRSRRMEVPLEIQPSELSLLSEAFGEAGVMVRWGDFQIHGTHTSERFARIVREALRVGALSRFLRDGELELPTKVGTRTRKLVLLRSKEEFLRAAEVARAAGTIAAEDLSGLEDRAEFEDRRGFSVSYDIGEVDAYVSLVHSLGWWWRWNQYGDNVQPCLSVGHLNWLCLSYFGVESTGVQLNAPRQFPAESHTRSPGEARRHEEMLQLSRAGIAGARAWLIYLCERGEDATWASTMRRQMGELDGNRKLKATFVVEYLQESGAFPRLLRESLLPVSGERAEPRERLEPALGKSVEQVEEDWRSWLLGGESGLLQRLQAASGAGGFAEEEQEALEVVRRVRDRAFHRDEFPDSVTLELDAELCLGCLEHSRYLERHPQQSAAWPDAHEEYPEAEGFSLLGSRAAQSSVIAPGVDSATEAIEGWMGTYYHRLPLLDPGLIRMGYGREDTVAVMDTGTLLAPTEYQGVVVWPPPDMTEVPTRFRPELPNPVPGEDQSRWGYPITLQAFGDDSEFRMALFEGRSASGPELPCHFSSPQHPLNIELAPAGCYTLIPLGALARGTVYTVRASSTGGWEKTWSFTTGR